MLRNCVIFCCIASANAGKCRLHVKNIKGRQCLKSMISLFSVDGGFSSSTPSLAVLQGTPPIARNIWPALSELVLQLTAGKVKWIHSMVEPLSNEYAPLLFPFLPSAFLGGPSKSSGRLNSVDLLITIIRRAIWTRMLGGFLNVSPSYPRYLLFEATKTLSKTIGQCRKN